MMDTWAPEDLRGYAFAIAYRMLGSVGEAEDVVQEAMIRLHGADRDEVRSPTAYVATVTTRLALDQLRSARLRRERYVGTWLPEPVLGEPGPAERAELRESLTAAFLLVLETLSPVERAVFVLHDLFDLPYWEVADVVDRSEPTCRQIAARARRHVAARRPRFDPPPAHGTGWCRFFAALDARRRGRLEKMLAADVVFLGDGGGRAPRSAAGPARCGWPGSWPASSGRPPPRPAAGARGRERRARRAGGRPGRPAGQRVRPFDFRDGRVVPMRSVINPDKLRHLGPLATAAELLGGPPQPGGNAK